MGESSGNIAGAGWVESAAAGKEGRSGVRVPLRSGLVIVEVIFGVSWFSSTTNYVSARPSSYIYVSRERCSKEAKCETGWPRSHAKRRLDSATARPVHNNKVGARDGRVFFSPGNDRSEQRKRRAKPPKPTRGTRRVHDTEKWKETAQLCPRAWTSVSQATPRTGPPAAVHEKPHCVLHNCGIQLERTGGTCGSLARSRWQGSP